MKILLVGDGNSPFIYNYAKWLKKEKTDIIVDIFSYEAINKDFIGNYNTIYQLGKIPWLFNFYSRLRRKFTHYNVKKILKRLSTYDVVHFHYISPLSFYISNWFKQNRKEKLVFSIWGSDFFFIRKRNEIAFKKACLNADEIVFTNEQLLNDFKNELGWNKENIRVCRFGLEPYEFLKKLDKSKDDCKKYFGFNQNKLTIAVGYNSNPAQQHQAIIKELSKLSKNEINKIQLFFNFSYGKNEDYVNKIIEELDASDFDYIILDKHLSDKDIAVLRNATDFMLQLPTVDQFSGTMLEYMYAGTIVLAGSWLPYALLKNRNVYYEEVSNLNQISDKLIFLLLHYEELKIKTLQNKDILKPIISWENNISEWIKLYKI